MREILFRAKRIDNGEWVEGYYITHLHAAHYIIPCRTGGYVAMDNSFYVHKWYEVYPETVGQYTGLTDENGKKIFEGDIVKTIHGVRRIVFEDGCFGARANVNLFAELRQYNRELKSKGGFEILGNIHDNPELLEAAQ